MILISTFVRRSTLDAAHLAAVGSNIARFMSSSSNTNNSSKQLADGGEVDHNDLNLSSSRRQIIANVQALFCSKPTIDIMQHNWTTDATFEDPICIASGIQQIAAQWWGMPKAFPTSITEAWVLVKDESNVLEFEQRQKYTIAGLGTTKVMRSLVHIELDGQDRIVRLVDYWDGKPMPSGSIALALRRFNGRHMGKIIGPPKI